MGCGLLCDPRFRGRRVALLLPCPEWPLSPRELDRPSVRRAERGQACGLRAGMTGSATCDGGSTTLSQVPAPTASAGNDQDVRAFRCGHAGNPAAGSTVLTYRARMVNGCMQLPNWTTPAMVGLPAVSLAEIIALPISSPAQPSPSRPAASRPAALVRSAWIWPRQLRPQLQPSCAHGRRLRAGPFKPVVMTSGTAPRRLRPHAAMTAGRYGSPVRSMA